MALLDFEGRTIVLNLAYFGALQSGAGSNVRHLHRFLPARDKAELRREGAKDRPERVWWFTYTPTEAIRIPGFDLKVRVASIPSGEDIQLDREAWLSGLDGVVFVADARAGRAEANMSALQDMEACLVGQGLDVGAIPVVFQINQTDAATARPSDRVVDELNPFGLPVVHALARTGTGVVETHDALASAVFSRLRDRMMRNEAAAPLTAVSKASRDRAENEIAMRAAALSGPLRSMPLPSSLPVAVEIPLRVSELRQSQPFQHVRTSVEAGRLRVEAVWRRTDGTQRKVAVLIEAGSESAATGPNTASTSTAMADAASAIGGPRARKSTAFAPDELPGELPRLAYGVVGVVGGVFTGFSLAYLVFGGA